MKTDVAENICAGYLRQAATDARISRSWDGSFNEPSGIERPHLFNRYLSYIKNRYLRTKRKDYFFIPYRFDSESSDEMDRFETRPFHPKTFFERSQNDD